MLLCRLLYILSDNSFKIPPLIYFTLPSLAFLSLFIKSPSILLLLSSLHSLAGPGLLCSKVENSSSSHFTFRVQSHF